MLGNITRLLTEDILWQLSRRQLEDWLHGNKTGAVMIRAGVPTRAPVLLAIYSVDPTALRTIGGAIAEAAKIVGESCR